MARSYKRDSRGRFAGSGSGSSSSSGGSKSSSGGRGKLREANTRDKLARTQRSRMTNRNSNDRRIALPSATSDRQSARIKRRISKRNTKIAASRARERVRRSR